MHVLHRYLFLRHSELFAEYREFFISPRAKECRRYV